MQDEIRRRWAAGVAWLRHSTGQSPQLTLWGWVADGLLALVLTIGAFAGVANHGDAGGIRVGPDGTATGPLFGLVVPAGPPAPAAPLEPRDPSSPLPDGYKLVPIPRPLPDDQGIAWWQYGLAALTALPLAARRRYPLASFWIIAIATAWVFRVPGG